MNIRDIEHKQLAIFGIGFHAQRCLYLLNCNNIDIECYYDNKFGGGDFRGKTVLKPCAENVKGKIIFVAVGDSVYQVIRQQLLSLGLKEFKDFIHYKLINRKTVVMHGNCHIEVMKGFLESSRVFSAQYSFYPLPVIMELDSSMLSQDVIDNCDMFLSQDIRINNPYGEEYSTDSIFARLPKTCQKYVIPNLYKLGHLYFPQYGPEFNALDDYGAFIDGKWDQFGYFPFSDCIIDKMAKEGLDTASIIEQCLSGKNFSKKEVELCFKNSMKKIRQREAHWDIKCADFIEENYKSHRLFYEPEHPTGFLFKYVCEKILGLLHISDEITTRRNIGGYETPIYPEVKEILGLKFDVEKVRVDNNSRSFGEIVSYEEYIRQYLWWREKIIKAKRYGG